MGLSKVVSAAAAVMLAVAFCCGLYGYITEMHLPADDALYKTLILYVLGGDTSDIPVRSLSVNVARFLAPLSLFLGGMQILLYLSDNGVRRLRRELNRNHYVVFGKGEMVRHTVEQLRCRMAEKGERHSIVVVGDVSGMPGVDIVACETFNVEDFGVLKLWASRKIIALYGTDIENLMLVDAVCKYLNPGFADVADDGAVASGNVGVMMLCRAEETEGLAQEIYRHKFGQFSTFKVVEEAVKSVDCVYGRKVVVFGLGEIGRGLIERFHSGNDIIGYDADLRKVEFVNGLYGGSVRCFAGRMEDVSLNELSGCDDGMSCFICCGDDGVRYRHALKFKNCFPKMDVTVFSDRLPTDFHALTSRGIEVCNYRKAALEAVFGKSGHPVISVVVPAYNAVEYLGECLDSLSKTSGLEMEFIVVNDGSDDKTSEVVRSFVARDGRFRLVESAHVGAGEARNIGVSVAVGDYVAFVDSDDRVSEDMFEVLYRKAIESNADITMCRALSMDSAGVPGKSVDCWNFEPGVYDRSRVAGCDFLNNICSPVLWDKLVKRDIALRYPCPKLRRGQDFIAVISMIHEARCVRIIDDELYYYRHHEGSTMAEPMCEQTVRCDFETEREAVRLVRKYWAGEVIAVSYEERVRRQWEEVMCGVGVGGELRDVISEELDELFGCDV